MPVTLCSQGQWATGHLAMQLQHARQPRNSVCTETLQEINYDTCKLWFSLRSPHLAMPVALCSQGQWTTGHLAMQLQQGIQCVQKPCKNSMHNIGL